MCIIPRESLPNQSLNPDVNNQTDQKAFNRKLLDNFEALRSFGWGQGNTNFNIIEISNTNNNITLPRSDSITLVVFIISDTALNCTLPLSSKTHKGDIFKFCIGSGSPSAHNVTIHKNDNSVNGSSADIVLSTDRFIELNVLAQGNIKGIENVLIV